MRWVAMGLIAFYRRWVSPLKPPTCRFTPTCSQYSYDAFRLHGFFKGGWLSLRRIFKCHPFHEGGWDPVPPVSAPSKTGINEEE